MRVLVIILALVAFARVADGCSNAGAVAEGVRAGDQNVQLQRP